MKNGFSVLEVILAVALFMIFSTGAIMTVVQSYNTNRLGTENTVASQFAAEGIEAVKSIKNQGYTNLNTVNDQPRGLLRNVNNVWAFDTDGTSDNLEKYTRTIRIEKVYRLDGNIVASGGTEDPDTKKVTSTATWNFNSARPETTTLTTYLSDWKKPIMGPVMMAYSKISYTPFYRTWDGSNWSSESAAQNVGGNINYVVLKIARTRNEAILGTLDSNGNIYAQIWNGSSWNTPILIANIGSSLAEYRSFDIEYEKNSDHAVIVYLPNSTSVDPAYRIWDGNDWLPANPISAPPTTGVIRWIEMAQNPLSTSNEISMIMLDANVDVYGMTWSGSSWNNMGITAVWDNTASIATRKAIDVAYEQTSGRALFIWGDAVARSQYYRVWDGSNLTPPSLLDIPASGGVANWVKLAPRPNSNELMYGVVDDGADLNTRKWSGSSWDTAASHSEHENSVENITSMVFDLVWETHPSNPSKAWLLWGNGTRVSTRQWSGTNWGSTTNLAGSDDTSFIKLKAEPSSGAIFAGLYEDVSAAAANRDIWESHLTDGGSTWSAKNTIWDGPTSATPVYFRIDIATQ